MAKGKHSTALFEVIHSANRPDRVAQSLRTPKWWFKGRQTPTPAPAGEPSFAPPEPEAPTAEVEPDGAMSAASAPPSYRDRGRSSAVHVDFNRNRKELTLRLRYTTALVSAFAVCMLIALSYVVGRHLGHGPQSASAAEQPTIEQLRQQPPQPGVTAVPRPHAAAPQVSPPTNSQRRQVESSGPAKGIQSVANPQATPGVDQGLPRVVGDNYVIIQTYPPQEAQAAKEACDFFNRNGISCTLEKNLAAYTTDPNWLCLVGTSGFPRIHSDEFRAYTQNISRIAASFKTSHFNRPDPQPYKWRGN